MREAAVGDSWLAAPRSITENATLFILQALKL